MKLAEWNKSTVILMERELGVATDTGEVRVGNGKDRWANLPVIKGEKGEPLKVESTTKNSQGDTIIKFDDGSSATVSKGDKGDSITISSYKKDGQGNTVINFSDGSNITVDKGDSITVESTSTDSNGNTLVKFSDGSSATIAKGDKGDPLKFEDLTQEQINQIKAQDVDLTNYATKDDLEKVDVSSQLEGYAKKNHTHSITDVDGLQTELDGKAEKDHTHDDVYAKGVGVDSNGIVKFLRDGKWYNYNSSSSIGNAVALKDHTHSAYVTNVGVNSDGKITYRSGGGDGWKEMSDNARYGLKVALKDHTHEITDVNGLQKELKTKASSTHYHDIEDINNLQTVLNGKASSTHTHDEYFKKGDPIELTSAQKAELKGADGLTTFIRYANNPSGTNMTASPKSDTTHIGIFASEGRVAPPTPSVYQWARIKGEPGKQGNPGTPGRDGTSVITWVGTQSEYNRIYSKSSTTLYLIKG